MLTVQPRYVRFHVLNGGVSRALSLNFQDANGKKYNDRCRIVGSDGGVIGKDRTGTLGGRPFPTRRGLFTSNAYRWDIVCDFRNLEGALFLTNEPNEDLMEPVPPMFCNSHLLMRIDITTTKNPSESLFPHKVDLTPASFNSPAHMADYSKLPEGETVVDTEVGAAALKKAARKALDGDADRRLHFKKQGLLRPCLCACMPAMRPCLRALQRALFRSGPSYIQHRKQRFSSSQILCVRHTYRLGNLVCR